MRLYKKKPGLYFTKNRDREVAYIIKRNGQAKFIRRSKAIDLMLKRYKRMGRKFGRYPRDY
jgi:hypothetical protein